MQPKKLPQGFVHLFQDKYFLRATFLSSYCSILETSGVVGRRYSFSFFCIEYYTTDIEPKLLPWHGIRLVIWNPVTKIDAPKKWMKSRFDSNLAVYSFIDTRSNMYWETWNKTLKGYRNFWQRQSLYVIKEISYKEYRELYAEYALPKKILTIFQNLIDRHYAINKDAVHCYILVKSQTEEILAGIATVDCDSIHQSYYLSAFTRKEMAPPQTGLWLLSHWMEDSKKRNIWFTNFGVIWTKGHPLDWKGFSDFKLKFHPHLIIFPKQLFRFNVSFFRPKS